MKNFEKIGNIGKGSFANVYLVKNTLDNQIYAMKQILFANMIKQEQESALNEVRILASIEHPNIIDFKEVLIDEKEKTLNIIMEFATDKDLLSKIKYQKILKKFMPEDTIWDYLIQMIFGLKFLHDKKIVHRDLKSANVFLSGNIIKIGDFNISKILKKDVITSSHTGTPYYSSPEIWSEKPYDYKTDIWSLGCIIYELCSLRPPFGGLTFEELYKNIMKGIYEPIPKIYSSELNDILSKMLTVNQSKRPDTIKLLSDSIILDNLEKFTNKFYLGNHQDIQMLKTIKFSVHLDELNKNLPKIKRYNCKSQSDKNLVTIKNYNLMEQLQKEKNMNLQSDKRIILLTAYKNESKKSDNFLNNLDNNFDVINSDNKNDKYLLQKKESSKKNLIFKNYNNNFLKKNSENDKKICLKKKIIGKNQDDLNSKESTNSEITDKKPNTREHNKSDVIKLPYSSKNVKIFKHEEVFKQMDNLKIINLNSNDSSNIKNIFNNLAKKKVNIDDLLKKK